jgi:hypothetical protein
MASYSKKEYIDSVHDPKFIENLVTHTSVLALWHQKNNSFHVVPPN